MKLVYPGPHDEVEVPEFGIVALQGVPVEVKKAAVERLKAQGWTEPKAGANSNGGSNQ